MDVYHWLAGEFFIFLFAVATAFAIPAFDWEERFETFAIMFGICSAWTTLWMIVYYVLLFFGTRTS